MRNGLQSDPRNGIVFTKPRPLFPPSSPAQRRTPRKHGRPRSTQTCSRTFIYRKARVRFVRVRGNAGDRSLCGSRGSNWTNTSFRVVVLTRQGYTFECDAAKRDANSPDIARGRVSNANKEARDGICQLFQNNSKYFSWNSGMYIVMYLGYLPPASVSRIESAANK